MKTLAFGTYAVSIGVVALLAGCGGVQPIGESSSSPQSYVRLLTNPRATARTAMSHFGLLYITDNGNGSVYVYTYPQGKFVQQFQYAPIQSPAGDCVDDRGNVFITGYNGHDVLIYSRGAAQPKAVLSDPGYPMGCSIDPNSPTISPLQTRKTEAPGRAMSLYGRTRLLQTTLAAQHSFIRTTILRADLVHLR